MQAEEAASLTGEGAGWGVGGSGQLRGPREEGIGLPDKIQDIQLNVGC